MVRAALYSRVSTEDQAKEGFSLDAQLEKLRAYCKIHGWDVAGEYVEDGQSGRTTKRKEYQRMLTEIDRWDTVVVLKMDRIHRNSRNFMDMVEHLKERGKEFASVMESLDTATAMGRFVADIICRIGQLESEQIGERVTVAMEQKAKQGAGSLGKPAPYGYCYQEGVLTPVAREARIVRMMFRWSRTEGLSYSAIAQRLNKAGYRTRNKVAWSYWNVKGILTNPTYTGSLVWKGIVQADQHEALVEG